MTTAAQCFPNPHRDFEVALADGIQSDEDLIPLWFICSGDADGYMSDALVECDAGRLAFLHLYPANDSVDEMQFASDLKQRMDKYFADHIANLRAELSDKGYLMWRGKA